MHSPYRRLLTCTAAAVMAATAAALAQRGGALTPEQVARRWQLENELASIAVIERKVMVPMRDGARPPPHHPHLGCEAWTADVPVPSRSNRHSLSPDQRTAPTLKGLARRSSRREATAPR